MTELWKGVLRAGACVSDTTAEIIKPISEFKHHMTKLHTLTKQLFGEDIDNLCEKVQEVGNSLQQG